MILKWLDRNALNNNVPKLLNLLNLQQNEDEAELLGLTILQIYYIITYEGKRNLRPLDQTPVQNLCAAGRLHSYQGGIE